MNKHIPYKVGLLIGLLHFNILSSCVHRGQRLGFGSRGIQPNWVIGKAGTTARCKGIKTIAYLSAAGLIVVGVVVRSIFRVPHLVRQANRKDGHRSGGPTTDLSFMPTQGYTTVMPYIATYIPLTGGQQFIIDAIQRHPADLVTDAVRNHRVALGDSMRLDKEILKDLQDNHFSIKRIAYWLAQGLNIDAKDVARGYTLLMYAVGYNKRVVQFIIDKGANVNAHAKDGRTALHLAVGRRRLAVVKCLLRAKNIDLSAVDKRKRTALDLAKKKSIYLAIWSRYLQEEQKVR